MTGRTWISLGAASLLTLSIACAGAPPTVAARRTPRGGAAARADSAAPVVDLRLESLEQARTTSRIGRIERNLFSFGRRAVAESDGAQAPRVAFPTVPRGNVTPAAPSLPPIALRYIGLLEAPSQAGRVAILTDGRGNIFYGREGETIEGRYLVVQVSATATELSYLDGRGRQTVRLSGQ